MAKQVFQHKKENDIFPDPAQLALEATRLGVTCEEFVMRYLENLRTAETWNTAKQFVATVDGVRAEQVANGISHGFVDVTLRSGQENSESQSLRAGILHPTDKTAEINALCGKAKVLIGKRAKITKVYQKGKDGSDFAKIISIDGIE